MKNGESMIDDEYYDLKPKFDFEKYNYYYGLQCINCTCDPSMILSNNNDNVNVNNTNNNLGFEFEITGIYMHRFFIRIFMLIHI